jgi:hypothetical protein
VATGTLGLSSSVTYETRQGTNSLFAGTTLTGPQSSNGSVSGSFGSGTGPYSLTQKVTITHGSLGSSAAIVKLSVPDGGWSITLLGLALVGVEGLRRKLASARA